MTYEPSLIVTAQGRKRVELGGKTFTYGSPITYWRPSPCRSWQG
jgi:hypothetical protein